MNCFRCGKYIEGEPPAPTITDGGQTICYYLPVCPECAPKEIEQTEKTEKTE